MQKILNKREKLILYITIGVVLFGVIFNLCIFPVFGKYSSLNKEIEVARTKYRKYQLLLSQKDYIQNKYKKFASEVNLSGSGNVLSELEASAKAADIRIIDIRPQNPSESSKLYKEIIVDLRTEGTMEGYLKFIYLIENSLSLLRAKRIQLTAKSRGSPLEGSFSISQVSLE